MFYSINPKYTIIKKDDAYLKIQALSSKFIELLLKMLEIHKLEEASIVGIGNSLTAGWSATNSDVKPFVLKLQDILIEEIQKTNININFHNYSTAAKNSNQEIYDFLQKNPSEKEVLERFKQDKEHWDKIFYNTPFQNYIDSQTAFDTYPNTAIKLTDNYKDNSYTISLINGCTGGILNAFSKVKEKSFLRIKECFHEDLYYLEQILIFIKSLKEQPHNLIIVGNFPYLSTSILNIFNRFIAQMNQEIQSVCFDNEVEFFNKNQIAFLQKFQNPTTKKIELKLDNHPTMDEQYTVLYHYFNYLISLLEKENQTYSRQKTY